MAFSPIGSCLAMLIGDYSGDQDDMIYWIELWHVDGRKPFKVFDKMQVDRHCFTESSSLTFSPDGNKLSVSIPGGHLSGRSGTVHVWNVNSGRCEQTLRLDAHPLKDAEICLTSFSSDGSMLASAVHKNIRIWCTSIWHDVCNTQLVGQVSKTSIADVKFMPLF
eukprot:gnl/MRDRNA2_/MRDRNA2_206286_c0_seq1.p1 gnl/MRDRNA2_/MRDRNA2_206286_c0~~gnl/MRDRNA2_/MRDRNA2_206286_c0_seq1.p1  ORF type:complete len:172 (-),score=19.21 gnl/MRDRNA2_/MRDRNA2_206286_c0_seq1:110-601(-)